MRLSPVGAVHDSEVEVVVGFVVVGLVGASGVVVVVVVEYSDGMLSGVFVLSARIRI